MTHPTPLPADDRQERDELELPPLDGGGDDDRPIVTEDGLSPIAADGADALDDAVVGDAGMGEEDFGPEESMLDGGEEAGDRGFDADVPCFADTPLGADDEPSEVEVDSIDAGEPSALVGDDAGEEGFAQGDGEGMSALPDLDQDDEGDAADLPLAEIPIGPDPTLPWDDRAFERVLGPLALGTVRELSVEGERVVARTDGELVELAATGTVLARHFHSALPLGAPPPDAPPPDAPPGVRAVAGATAEVTLAGGVLAAIYSQAQGRAWLVRSAGLGAKERRIVADVTDDAGDADPAPVLALVVEPSRGWVWVGGEFGLLVYRRK